MDLLGHTWMQRQLGQAVSCVHITSENGIIAGGWDGRVAYWNEEGGQQWQAETSSRVSAILEYPQKFVVTSGLEVVAITKSNGEIMWTTPLEGSADGLLQFEQFILATSSAYDIEHNDFIESALWRLDVEGNIKWVHRLDERPWYGFIDTNVAHFGLGRPRCGMLSIGDDGLVQSHSELPHDSPVMCGASIQTGQIFGLASGHIVSKDSVLVKGHSGVEFLSAASDGFIAGHENGDCTKFDENGASKWTNRGEALSGITSAWERTNHPLIWISRKRLDEGELTVLNADTGTPLAEASTARIHSMASTSERLCVGLEDGQVLVWDREMFERRQHQDAPQQDLDPEKEAMRARLRALRR